MYVTDHRLTLHELARLLKTMTDYAYAHPWIATVGELLKSVAREFDIALTDEHRGQIYGALSLVVPMPSGTVQGPNMGPELDRAIVVSNLDRTPDTLGKVVFRAWQNVTAAARQEPAELWIPETGGLLMPDPRDADLDGLSIAATFFLVAHDKLDGRALLSEPVLACSVAAALLAELLLLELVSLEIRSHRVLATDQPSQSVPGITVPVRQALEMIQDSQPATLGSWLTRLSPKGHLAVRRHLLEAGVVARKERGRIQKKACYLPADEIVDSIFRVATRPLAVGRMPTAPHAVLIELAKTVHLTAARYGEWVYVHRIDHGATLAEVPGRERLDLLLALTRAEVTDLLTRP